MTVVQSPPAAHARDVLFLSHAMPEDTQFAVWLGVQLANHGYRVWSEATQLIGGERFWTDIEDAFDTVVGKTIVVVSKVTRSKNGVLNEIERAEATAQALGIPMSRFVVPVAVEEFQRRDMPIQIARQNAVPFKESWADGLAKLLKLLEKEQFPRAAEPVAVGRWVRDWYEGRHQVVAREDTMVSNVLRITRLPERIRFYYLDVPRDKLAGAATSLPFPTAVHDRLVLAFAAMDEVQAALPPTIEATLRAELALDDFLKHRLRRDDPVIQRRDARNHVTSMLRQAWNRMCEARGLAKLELANSHACWFFPEGAIEGGFVRFNDVGHTKPRRKSLYGVKTKRTPDGGRSVAMHWHFAPRAMVSLGELSVTLEPHVAFTTDGRTLLGETAKSHRLRRSFCKTWFNEQWRTLHLAYVAGLSGGCGELEVPLSADQSFAVSAVPTTLTAPVTYELPARKTRADSGDQDAEVVPDEAAEDLDAAAGFVGGWDDLDEEDVE